MTEGTGQRFGGSKIPKSLSFLPCVEEIMRGF